MITESIVYWILKLDDMQRLFVIGSLVVSAFACLSLFAWSVNCLEGVSSDFGKAARKYFFCSAVLAALLSIPATLLPTTKQMAMIKVIPAIANSEIVGEVSADAKEIYKLGINAIKESLGGVKK